jgi:ferredoxin-NADP reductase/DMSO/TMAO reductase YedYZ heme-binding membrane subunit
LLVSYWWATGGGVGDVLASWAQALVSVGRLSGLVASVLLLVQVVLMARVPLLERAFGQDRLALDHRIIGFTSFNLMWLHIVAITWGYAGGSTPNVPAMLWRLVVDYPGMLLAAAGTVALVLVVVTSVKRARRRLRYESWHLLHLYAYLGAGLALPHQLWTGQQLATSPLRTLFWWTAWGAAAGSVLLWRVGLPLGRNARMGLRVAEVVPEGPGVASVHLTGRDLHRFDHEAGQFYTWRFLGRKGWTRANPYSLSAAPGPHHLRITVQDVGDGSRAAHDLRPGMRVLVEGPFGRLSERARTQPKVALIAAGVGMAPIRALAEGLAYGPGEAVVLQRYTDHPLYAAELDWLADKRGLRVLRLPGRRRGPHSWLGHGLGPVSDLDALRFWVPDIAERDVFLCGPAPWAELVIASLRANGVPPSQIHFETFAW